MVFDLTSVMVLLFFATLAGAWWKSRAAQERALRAARDYCKMMDLQLLDECAAECSWRLGRDDKGSLCLERHYQFEFTSTGEERYLGEVVMKGQQLQQVVVAPHRVH